MDVLANARRLVALEEQIKEAVRVIAKASLELNSMGMDVTLAAWDWNRRGHTGAIMPQGGINVRIVDINDRPK